MVPVNGYLMDCSLQIIRMDYSEINIDHKFHRHLIGKSGANSELDVYSLCA